MGAEAFLTWCLAMTEWTWWKGMAVRGVVGWRTGILAAFTLVAAAVLAYWTRRHRRRSFPVCEQIPPPRSVSLQKNSNGHSDPCQPFKYLVELMEKHGPTVRVQEQDTVYVIISQPEDVESIKNGHVVRPKSGLHRRIASSTFHNSILRQYVDHFNRHSWTLGDQLENTKDDIFPAVRLCSLKVLCEVLTGTVPSDTQSASILQDLQKLQRRRFLPLQNLLHLPGADENLTKLYDFLDGVIADKEEQRDLIKGKRSLQNHQQVEYVQWVRGQEKCLLELLLEDNGQSPRAELCELLASGTEVVALAVCYTLALLAEHPQVQHKVAVEQERVCGSDKHATAEDLAIMIYLDQVIKESLRLFPPLPLQFWIVERDTEISNYTLPAGSVAVVFSYATHRNWRVFPDPAVFKPERFFSQDDPSQDTRYLAFGAGRGACLAAKFSLWEMKTILSTVLRRYYVSWAEGAGGLQEVQRSLQVGPLLRPASGFNLRFSPRPAKVIPSIFRNGTGMYVQ